MVGQRDPGEPAPNAGLAIEQVLFAAGRPVLVVPHAGSFESLGRRVLVGWNASREAARAVADALPILAAAESVTVLAVDPDASPNPQGGGARRRHRAAFGAAWRDGEGRARDRADDTPDAEVLLNKASELAADLIVVGAYGHSRLREMVLGGVTRTLLQRMTVPVLMSH